MKRNGKATRTQLKRHNQRLILRAIYSEQADNRAALASETRLAKPTVSDIVSDLIDRGFIEEGGRGNSTTSGGKRPRLLKFVPAARQVIGVSLTRNQIEGCLANLDGAIIAKHYITPEEHPDIPLLTQLEYLINALIAQLDAPLLCISVGVSGIVNNIKGVVISSRVLDWVNVPLSDYLNEIYDVPIYVSNNTELATRAQVAYHNDTYQEQNLVTVLINHSIEIGVAYGTQVFHHGSDIEGLQLSSGKSVLNLSWGAIKARAETLKNEHPDSLLADPDVKFTYLYLRYAINQGDKIAGQLVDEIADLLAEMYAWIIGLMRPDKITLAGSLSHIGDPLLNAVRDCTIKLVPAHVLNEVEFTFAQHTNLSTVGAVASALQKELGIL